MNLGKTSEYLEETDVYSRLQCVKNIFSKEPKKVEYTTFKPDIGDLSKYASKFAQPIEERLKKQIDDHNIKVSKESIDSKIDEAVSKYATFKPSIDDDGKVIKGKASGELFRTVGDWENIYSTRQSEWEKTHLDGKVTEKPDI